MAHMSYTYTKSAIPNTPTTLTLMASEETPLLSDETQTIDHDLIYHRFSDSYKKYIVALVSWCGLLPLFISGTFLPSIPQIAKDLHTSGENVNLAVSLSVLAASLGALSTSAYSTYYGRRPVYLFAFPLSIIGSIGVAASYNIPELLFWRFWQAVGASPGMAVGAAVIGDIYGPEDRGTAIGIFFAATLLGPALAPTIGGFAAHYSSWRVLQLWLGIFGALSMVLIAWTFPETSHPGERGIDKIHPSEQAKIRWLPVFINPLAPLGLLRNPSVACMTAAGFLIILTDYVLFVPLAYTIGKRYNIDNEAVLGTCFVPCGLGNMIGAPAAGYISDKVVIQWKNKRGGLWYPEDRLRATLFGAAVLAPLSVLACALFTTYIEGRLGLTLNLISLFINGLGVSIVLGPCASYIVDTMQSRSAEAMACNTGFRSLIISLAITGILPMINTYGLITANALSATLCWIGFLIILLTIRYGRELRSWNDIGLSAAENN